jgi:hypothetical protein
MKTRKKRYNHADYISGVTAPLLATDKWNNLTVAELTEKEAKDELCYAYDVLNHIRCSAGDLSDFTDRFLEEETRREGTRREGTQHLEIQK